MAGVRTNVWVARTEVVPRLDEVTGLRGKEEVPMQDTVSDGDWGRLRADGADRDRDDAVGLLRVGAA